ncbi:unnamed protein product, partial [Fusarium langsethiae]
GSQSRTWTTFIEAVTADGRLLKPGIIFKGKELQQQWFIDEFRKITDWYYITSDNGWTDNHIAVEWLKEVYLPQTQPADESDARLIILDGHGSHVSDEWMATCFLNNVYCCYLPAHCSHGLQPLGNGVFNASKAAYRKELQKLTSLTDSAPVGKVDFIKAYAKARAVGMTKKNILLGWRVTGNWPISRRKALMHPEIQPDKNETTPGTDGYRDGQVDSDHTPTTSRHIRDLGKNKSPSTRRRYSVISRGFEAQEPKIASLGTRIASLEEEVGRLSRGKKRKAIPNPNKRFMILAEALVTGGAISEPNEAIERADAVEDVIDVGGMEEDERSNSEEELTVIIDANPALAAQNLGDFPNVPSTRQQLLETASQLPPPNLAGIKKSEVQIPVRDGSSIRALIYKPAAPRSYDSPLAVLFHGGGWCIGVPELEELNAAKLVRNHGAVVLSIDYRKAPEKPFPTAVTDSWDALVWCYGSKYTSYEQNRNAPGLDVKAAEFLRRNYAPGPKSELFSPLLWPSGHGGLPKTFLQISGLDPLRDDGLIYARELHNAGVDVKINTYPGVPHGFEVFFSSLDIAEKASEEQDVGFKWLFE